MAFPSFFIIFIILVVLFQYHLRKNMRIEEQAKEEFWQKEKESLIVRKKNFSPEDYIKIPDDNLDLDEKPNFNQSDLMYYKQLIHQLHQLEPLDKMNFSHLSNTDIRLQFGTANQTIIQNNETNYNNYLQVLGKLAKLYQDNDDHETAQGILERCIAMKSDYRDHYMTLASLYVETGRKQALLDLIQKAESLESPLKKGLVESLKSL